MKRLVHFATLAGLLLSASAGAVPTSTTTTTTPPVVDTDRDGVPDSRDKCPNTARGEVVDRDGCSVAQLCPCDAPRAAGAWKSHGQYVSCLRKALRSFQKSKLLDAKTAGRARAAAKHSQCGAKARSVPKRIRCCEPEPKVSAKPFCAQLAKHACAHQHGLNIGSGSCVPNPCR